MNNNQSENGSLALIIIQLMEKEKPETVQQLVNLVKKKISIPEPEVIEHIIRLQSQGKITLESLTLTPRKLGTFLKTKKAYWYWITIILAATATIAVFTIPEDAYPMVYLRYLLGAIFVMWLPGYCFIKALFPKELPFKTTSKGLDSLIRIALSIGLNFALVSIGGLLLNYTPWGIRLPPIVLILFALIAVFATSGIVREHQSQLEQNT